MKLLATIFISVIASVASFVALYAFVPLDWIDALLPDNTLFGATVLTIQGSDTLSASRTTINNNFTALNTAKFENASIGASLDIGVFTAGNLTATGTVSFTNALPVASGGTASTTISSNQVILGNGSSGFKTVTGFGTSGQSLVSNGSAAAPTWQSVSFDTTGDYTNTGAWTFNGASTTNFAISNYLKLNGLIYTFPSGRGAANTVLTEDGAGALTWGRQNRTLAITNAELSTTASASTTLYLVTLPANTISTTATLRIRAIGQFKGATNTCFFGLQFGTGSATTSIGTLIHSVAGYRELKGTINATSTTAQANYFEGLDIDGTEYLQSRSTSFSTAAPLYLAFEARNDGSSIPCAYEGITVELIQ
jgi:hypothetical protein